MTETAERQEKFTQGPWAVQLPISEVMIGGHPHDVYPIESDTSGCAVCIIPNEDITDENILEVKANAALISAAPDMYAKLESLKRYVSESCGDACGSILVIREIDAILSKARGES